MDAESTASPLRVLHASNAGVLLERDGHCLGIDLFSCDPNGLYPDTPPEVREQLLERIELGQLNQLLITHEHGDHFRAEDVAEASRRNPGLHLISTEAVFEQLHDGSAQNCASGYMMAADRVSNAKLTLEGFSLELFNSTHMGEEYAKVQSLVCLVTSGEMHILITGDAAPSEELFARVARWSPVIDLMIVPFPVIGLPSARRAIGKSLTVRQVLAVHLPRPEKDPAHWVESAKNICARAEDGLPMPVFGEKLGREYSFEV